MGVNIFAGYVGCVGRGERPGKNHKNLIKVRSMSHNFFKLKLTWTNDKKPLNVGGKRSDEW